MVKLFGTLSRLEQIKALVIGDFMLDAYTIGKAMRISPEAPVAVINVEQEETRIGGAGNVILNMVSLGANVVAVGRVGDDTAGQKLLTLLEIEGVKTEGLIVQPGYLTPIKNRIIADNQQIVRVDHEKIEDLPEFLEKRLLDALPILLKGVQVVAISDYGKGFLTESLLSALIGLASKLSIPIVVDPKGLDFAKYRGATILKPNLTEAYAAAKMPRTAPLKEVASELFNRANVDVLVITKSEQGITVFFPDGKQEDHPVQTIHEVKDVTGAGDTVSAMFAVAIGNSLPVREAAQLANVSAAVAIERLGCARVSLSDIAKSLLLVDCNNKIFDSDHLFVLKQALQGRNISLVNVFGSVGSPCSLLQRVCELGQIGKPPLLIHFRDAAPTDELLGWLKALRHVDFIVLPSSDAENLSEQIFSEEVHVINAV